MAQGAFGKKPGFQVAQDPAQLAAQEARANRAIAAKGGIANAPKWASRLTAIQQAQGAAGQTPAQPSFDYTTGQANQAISGAFNNIQNLQPMNMDYGAMRQKAEQTAMDAFNRQMQPQFQREEEAFRQRMAEQGIDPNGEQARRQFEQLKQQQGAMTQNAMTSAFQAGQGEQAQMFNQGVTGQLLPYQQIGALTPYYASQAAAQQQGMQNRWQGRQNDLSRAAALQQSRIGAGGAMTMADRFALQDQQFQQQMALLAQQQAMQNGQEMPRNGMINGAIAGTAQGVAQGVVGGMLR